MDALKFSNAWSKAGVASAKLPIRYFEPASILLKYFELHDPLYFSGSLDYSSREQYLTDPGFPRAQHNHQHSRL